MRGSGRLALGALCCALGLSGAWAQETMVTATQIATFQQKAVGQSLGKLIWRGGISLASVNQDFGGLSSMGFVDDEGRLVFVSDRGNFVTGQLIYDEDNRPFNLVGVRMTPIENSSGAPLPRQFARDAEALDVVVRDGVPSAIRVGFENLTRVADFELVNGVPQGPAREVSIPQWISDIRTNESIESLCIAPPASPVAGSTLIILESVIDSAGNHSAYLLGRNDRGALSLSVNAGVNPTDCAFMPNGDLLVLERGVSLFAFVMKLRRIPADQVKAGQVMSGEILLEAAGSDIDNMEAVAVHTAPDGELRITIGSDNNFNSWERNLLLEFSLPETL